MDTKPYIIANWKMNLDGTAVDRYLKAFDFSDPAIGRAHVIFAPSFVHIAQLHGALAETGCAVAGQDMFGEDSGAYTGEVSASQLVDAGCQYVLLGHSERRALSGETDLEVNAKVHQAIKRKLRPIVCFGESYAEKEAGETKQVVQTHVTDICRDVRAADVRRMLFAYEPLWAISTSTEVEKPLADTPESAQVVHKLIRKTIRDLYDEHVAGDVRILYGGSVDPENVSGFAAMDDIDGVLVGGASKEAHSFQRVITNYISASA